MRNKLLTLAAVVGVLTLFLTGGIQKSYYSELEKEILSMDKTPPSQPGLIPPPTSTKEDYVAVNGNAEANSTLKVFRNFQLIDILQVDETTHFSIKVELEPGKNEIWFTVTDRAGNESERSQILFVTFEKEKS